MASENLLEDENHRNVAGGVTALGEIRMVRINPVTGALICEAVVTSSNTSIGSTIAGLTAGSILFGGLGGTLAQDNANLFWDDTDNYLGLGTNTPSATLHVIGSVRFDLGGDSTGDIYYRDSSGDLVNLAIGTSGYQLTVSGGLPSWQPNPSLVMAYTTIENDGVAVTQEDTINLSTLLLAADDAGKTSLTIDVVNLANDSTFVNALIANATFVTDLSNDTTFINSLTSNTTFLTDIVTNISGDVEVVADGVTITGTGTTLDPLVAVSGSGVQSVTGLDTDNTDPVNPIVRIAVDGTTITGDGTSGDPLVASSANKIAIDTTQVVQTGTTENTLYTVPIVGGTLGTSNAIRFSLLTSATINNMQSANLTIRAKYGGTTIATAIVSRDTSTTQLSVQVAGLVVANNATNAQKGEVFISIGDGALNANGQNASYSGYGTAAIDSTATQNLVITAQCSANQNVITAEGIIVEKIA